MQRHASSPPAGVRALRLALTLGIGCGIAIAIAAPRADAAISSTPGADTLSSPRLELDFGDAGANVERVDSLRWRDSGGTLGPNLAVHGATTCLNAQDVADAWGEAKSAAGMPAPVGGGTTGTWIPRGGRTVTISSSRPTVCTADTVVTPVTTRYTFFDVGAASSASSRVRVERSFFFSASTPSYAGAGGVRPYIARLSAAYSQVVHPNSAGTALATDAGADPATPETNWNGTWLALNNPATNAGLVILRDPANSNPTTSPRLMLETNSPASSNSSSVDLVRPASGWHTTLRETEFLCFYDATSWPVAQRTATNLPSQCTIALVPINTGSPTIGGTAQVASTLVASPGTWDYVSGAFSYQWLRCTGGACTAIDGATGKSYTATDADEGQQLRVDVTATASGGQTDTASASTDGVKPGPPTSTGLPAVSGEVRALETLTGTPGSWTGSPDAFLYQWLRCATAAGESCTDVPGATGATYKLGHDDVGSTMRLRVQATNAKGTTAADSAATGVVQPEVLRARLEISPESSCTGLPVVFDGSGSTTPNGPIVRYELTFRQFPIGIFFLGIFGADLNQLVAMFPLQSLSSSSAAVFETTFAWNRQIGISENENNHKGGYVRDPMLVTLTVTDRAGAQASTSTALAFAQTYSTGSRASCPKPLRRSAFVAVAKARDLSVFADAFRATVPCESYFACAARLEVFETIPPRPKHKRRRAKGAAARRAVKLAQSPLFAIPARQSQAVSAKLTKAGRARLRPGRRVRATIRITSVTPEGRTVVRSFKANLRRGR